MDDDGGRFAVSRGDISPSCPLIETFTRHSYALVRRNLVDLYAGVFFTLFFINEAPGITAGENLSFSLYISFSLSLPFSIQTLNIYWLKVSNYFLFKVILDECMYVQRKNTERFKKFDLHEF